MKRKLQQGFRATEKRQETETAVGNWTLQAVQVLRALQAMRHASACKPPTTPDRRM